MGHGVVKVYTATLTTGATLTSYLDLSTRAWGQIYLEIPSMTSGTDLYVQGSHDSQTFRRVMHPTPNTHDFQINTFSIGSACSNRLVLIPNGLQYVKIEASTLMSSTAHEFNLICSD